MDGITLWSNFCLKYNIDPNTHYEEWAFGGGVPDKLAAHVMNGAKTATASLYDLYKLGNDPVPKVGDYSVILNSKGEAICIIQTVKMEAIPFDEVGEEQAYNEGEGDRSLTYWRTVHQEFFIEEAKEYNFNFEENSKVLCETFKLCYSLYRVEEMTEAQAREVVSWEYSNEYSVYNLPLWEECVKLGWKIADKKKRENCYYTVIKEGVLLGYFHFTYVDDYISLGLGIKPEFCGQNNGEMFLHLALAKIENSYPKTRIQLTVRPFNQRAIKCYEKVGFKIIKEYYEDKYIVPGEMYLMELIR